MAKVNFLKLNLTKKDNIEILEWNNQKVEIKQYLPIKDKLELITKIIQFAMDDHVFINPSKVEIFECLEIILAYTNINITDKQAEDTLKMYDLFVSSGLYQAIKNLIPEEEYLYIHSNVLDTIHEIYNYKHSLMGIIEQTQATYKDIGGQVEEIESSLSNPDTMSLLKEVVTKLN